MVKKILREIISVIALIGIIPIILILGFFTWLMPSDEELARESYEE